MPSLALQPPLPPGPPPSAPRMYYSYHSHHSHHSNNHSQHPRQQNIPPISQLLYQEADAWSALLALHSGVVNAASQIATATSDANALEASGSTELREQHYCASLSTLASHADTLHSESIRLRTLRKTRRSVDVEAIERLMQSHAHEMLALGSSLAQSGSLSLQSVTAELRTAIQASRSQIAQTRALLEILQKSPSLATRVQIGIVLSGDGDEGANSTADGAVSNGTMLVAPERVLEAVFAVSTELTEDALAAALDTIAADFQECSTSPAAVATTSALGPSQPAIATIAAPAARLVPRRTGDRGTGSACGGR